MKDVLSLVIDITGKIVLANENVASALGYSTKELTSMYIKDLLSLGDSRKFHRVAEKAANNNEQGFVKMNLESKYKLSKKVVGVVEESCGFYHLSIELVEQKSMIRWFLSHNDKQMRVNPGHQLVSNVVSFM